MENNHEQPNENVMVAKFDPALVYAGASRLQLSESEMKSLAAPFADLDYEIRPDGYIYLPQVLALQRLNNVIGIGRWSLLLISNGKDEVEKDNYKVFFDGALVIRDCFVSRSVGESHYNRKNKNSSWASAFEAAKSDCRQRCCKDIGIANDAWNPTFVRNWQRNHAIRVWVDDNGSKKVIWRRKDIDPFYNELGPVPTTPTMQQNGQPIEKGWLNHGPDYDAVLRELIAGETTLATVRATRFKISKETEAALIDVLTKHWINKTDECSDLARLTKLYDDNKTWIDSHPFIVKVFTDRKAKVTKKEAKAA